MNSHLLGKTTIELKNDFKSDRISASYNFNTTMSANRMQGDDGISDSTRKVSLKISLELKHSTIRATIVLVRTFYLRDIFSKFII